MRTSRAVRAACETFPLATRDTFLRARDTLLLTLLATRYSLLTHLVVVGNELRPHIIFEGPLDRVTCIGRGG